MAEISPKYMTVSVDMQPDGLNLACWFSTAEFWAREVQQFPFAYTHVGDTCTWIIHANSQLTIKACSMVTEYADKICKEAREKNERRKIANR